MEAKYDPSKPPSVASLCCPCVDKLVEVQSNERRQYGRKQYLKSHADEVGESVRQEIEFNKNSACDDGDDAEVTSSHSLHSNHQVQVDIQSLDPEHIPLISSRSPPSQHIISSVGRSRPPSQQTPPRSSHLTTSRSPSLQPVNSSVL